MLSDADKRLVDRYFDEILSGGDFSVNDEILAPDFTIYGLETLRDRDQFLEVQSTVLREAFPDLIFELHDVFGDENKVAVRATMRGTHQGEYLGIAPTGNQVEVETITILRISGERIVEVWSEMDSLTWFQQLGAVPQMDWQAEEPSTYRE
ncbi:ester cyclase [Haladaptatus pallidirubidus]|uniref:Ester cyclase n=1 Tax=Haladaptatus pallidirubidus TaxID=1008152 RepID=A0AAV3URD8_9EURY|nr:ester cyclase [Haladaptatus pallidirubidus]